MFIDFEDFRTTVLSTMIAIDVHKKTTNIHKVSYVFKSPERGTAVEVLQKHDCLGTAGEPADPPDPRHGPWHTTPGTLVPEVRMTLVLNKLPQTT